MWRLEIEKIENGFVLSYKVEVDENKFKVVRKVIEESDDEKETMTRLLERMAEYFGIHHDKYSKENLSITWDKKGHKL